MNIPEELMIRLKLEAAIRNITVTKFVTRIIFKELKELEKLDETKEEDNE